MANTSPIFPMPEPQHFSDYGFDPQIDYFQILEEARKHNKRERSTIDSFHFKLQKPISKDESKRTHKCKTKKKKRWWRNALHFLKRRWTTTLHASYQDDDGDVHRARARAFRASISGPVYVTDSRSGSATPYRTSGPLTGGLGPITELDLSIPYLSLRELTMEQQQRVSTSTMPIYLVT